MEEHGGSGAGGKHGFPEASTGHPNRDGRCCCHELSCRRSRSEVLHSGWDVEGWLREVNSLHGYARDDAGCERRTATGGVDARRLGDRLVWIGRRGQLDGFSWLWLEVVRHEPAERDGLFMQR